MRTPKARLIHMTTDWANTVILMRSSTTQVRKYDEDFNKILYNIVLGNFSERDMPDYSSRNFEERGFTIGIGGCVYSSVNGRLDSE